RDILFPAAYRSIDRDCGAGIGQPPPPAARASESFYTLPDSAIATYARILLSFVAKGGVQNKAGQQIPVDFSDLDVAGLTRPRLDAMAHGVTDRTALLAP